MPKSYIRSFRYDDTVNDILNEFPGDSLNEKFDNLIYFCFLQLPKLKKEISDLENDILQKKKILRELSFRVQDLEALEKYIETANSSVNRISSFADEFVNKVCNTIL